MEGLDAILLSLVDALAGGDTHDWQVLERITHDRGPTTQRIRQLYLEGEVSLPSEQRTQLLRLTTLVEREIWLVNALVRSAARPEWRGSPGIERLAERTKTP